MKKSAFTLIELLVVIAIIAILAGIALPVFNKVQEKGRATSDASNLRQLGLGIQAYLNDSDDQMFSMGAGDANSTPWPSVLNPKYVASWKVFRSPFDKISNARPASESAATGAVPVSYGVNVNVFDTNASRFVAPSQLVIMAPNPTPGPEVIFTSNSAANPILPMPAGTKGGTHNGRTQINALFADSHVSSVQWTEFANVGNEEGMKRWYPLGKPQ
jgi:prepilin-type N-terminal cleavage/methylation domain-containing protein/prepilin-type processing-associated H-X9-DG protein